MPKRPISVTLGEHNVTWLRGRAGALNESVSEVLDQIVTAARKAPATGPSRTVVGTLDIDASDPLLERADAAVRAAFEMSIGRPLLVREERARFRTTRRKSGGRNARG